jgi:hypothetical protein
MMALLIMGFVLVGFAMVGIVADLARESEIIREGFGS